MLKVVTSVQPAALHASGEWLIFQLGITDQNVSKKRHGRCRCKGLPSFLKFILLCNVYIS